MQRNESTQQSAETTGAITLPCLEPPGVLHACMIRVHLDASYNLESFGRARQWVNAGGEQAGRAHAQESAQTTAPILDPQACTCTGPFRAGCLLLESRAVRH
jgi:hypothetical protein